MVSLALRRSSLRAGKSVVAVAEDRHVVGGENVGRIHSDRGLDDGREVLGRHVVQERLLDICVLAPHAVHRGERESEDLLRPGAACRDLLPVAPEQEVEQEPEPRKREQDEQPRERLGGLALVGDDDDRHREPVHDEHGDGYRRPRLNQLPNHGGPLSCANGVAGVREFTAPIRARRSTPRARPSSYHRVSQLRRAAALQWCHDSCSSAFSSCEPRASLGFAE